MRRLFFVLIPLTAFLEFADGLTILLSPITPLYRLTISGLINLVMVGVTLLVLIVRRKELKFRLVLPGLLFVLSYLGTIREVHLTDGLIDWIRVVGWVSGIYLAFLVFDRGVEDFKRLFLCTLIASVIPLIFGGVVYFTRQHQFWGWFGKEFSDMPDIIRIHKGTATSRAAGSSLLALMPLFLVYPLSTGSWRRSLVGLVYSLIASLVCWFSYGRALVGSFFLFFLPLWGHNRTKILFYAMIIVVFPLLLTSDWDSMRLRLSGIPFVKHILIKPEEVSVDKAGQVRYNWVIEKTEEGVKTVDPRAASFPKIEFWLDFLSQWRQQDLFYKVFGSGSNSLEDSGSSLFLGLLFESGALSLLGYLYLMGSLFYFSVVVLRNGIEPYQKVLGLISIATIISFAFLSIFSFSIRGFEHLWYRAILWGMVLREYHRLRFSHSLEGWPSG